MNIVKLEPLNNEMLEEIGLEWHTDSDNTPYIQDEAIGITNDEAEAFYEAGNELYDMFIEAGEYVIKNNLFFELDIPTILIDTIKQSWENEVHWHIYGRFDFAGGIDGKPIKLLEFNADTPTLLYESALVQWALLKHNGMNEDSQFNNIFEAVSNNFKRMITLGNDIEQFDEIYEGWSVLFSSIRGNSEEERTTRFLMECALNAGLNSNFCYIDEIVFNEENGVFFNDKQYEFLFKLLPWEIISIDEPELALIINKMMENKNTIFLNPAYTLLFQSKRMLKILWDLFPSHPLLLETSYDKLNNKKQIEKVSFGREGANIKILDNSGKILEQKDGEYGNYKKIYQEFYELNFYNGFYYQPNVFFAYESCGLGFRKGGGIMDNMSKFVSHFIK
ncbi:glutathionylspermidine synthase family protein [Helicobacter sp. MIT 14-3879]|uniref:glutathionylspermidine synthase family protein n=1 Tax=Helicobacter sp. MIT 14-3879 TaxID=2040649 RepID=UPI000E1E879E|nr:glutathionylspermidine synthase family protein [Helicobacter sp. MIT 14-3879]RDU65191.1 glutathionylspermidine synthase [Helicobacter sp. MIT 14-3879]